MTGETWQAVCDLDDLEVDRGVAALVHGQAVALFRTARDDLFAIGNQDPFHRASMLARGIVGRKGRIDFVASPLHRRSFDLATGLCLEDPGVQVTTYDVRVTEGVVQVGARRERAPSVRRLRRTRKVVPPRRPELSRWPPLLRRAR
ncbi:nitrite reductase small subunit NirD [Nocardioides gilvus]|uniref:nitrite reductase small subunit NirD n=1 Tax=Nocardioides gilvus TaxID=1735589 RepID=UPI000D74BE94